jgi:hypothetical protein
MLLKTKGQQSKGFVKPELLAYKRGGLAEGPKAPGCNPGDGVSAPFVR